jgi:redox-sensitive bicupin YhaK (pirin superfamily)
VYAGLFDGSESASLAIADGRRAYVHVVRGKVSINGVSLGSGDALKVFDTGALSVRDGSDAEILVFDLPGA